MISDFISYLRYELNHSVLTCEAYERDLRQFSEWLAPKDLNNPDFSSLTQSDVRAWLASISRKNLTPRTIRRKAQSIRAFFRYLMKKGIITSNPTTDLILPKLPKPLPDVIRHNEIEQVLDTLESVDEVEDIKRFQELLIVETLYTLGIRRAELIALNDADISPSAGEIKVTGKRSKQRIVPAPSALVSKIRQWQRIRDEEWHDLPSPRPLFVVNGKRISAAQVYYAVKKNLANINARKKSPHALRHSFASSMLDGGADLNSVKEFLGHTSLATTQIYTHVSLAEIRKAYQTAHPRANSAKERNSR